MYRISRIYCKHSFQTIPLYEKYYCNVRLVNYGIRDSKFRTIGRRDQKLEGSMTNNKNFTLALKNQKWGQAYTPNYYVVYYRSYETVYRVIVKKKDNEDKQ